MASFQIPARRPLVLAHRGASLVAPENTLAAFIRSVADGADGVETDVRLSKDGQPVIIHDESVGRTTDGSGLVADKTLQELKELDAAARWPGTEYAGQRLPTLQELFDCLGPHLLLNIELKSVGTSDAAIVETVVACIRRNHRVASVLVTSFHQSLLQQVRRLDPDIRIGVLCMRRSEVAGLEHLKPESVNPHFSIADEPLVTRAQTAGQQVYVWTIDEPGQMQHAIRLGVDGIITNAPAVLKAILDDIFGLSWAVPRL